MRRALLGAVLVLALAPALWAQDDKDKPKPDKPSPADELKALQTEQAGLQAGVSKSLKGAQTPEDRQKIFQDYNEKMGAFPKRFLELARKHPKDPVAVRALAQVLGGRRPAEVAEALELLQTEHVQSENVGVACEPLAYSNDPAAEKFLRAVLEKNPHEAAQAQAAFSLASHFKNRAQARGLSPDKADPLNREADQLFEQVVTKYPAVRGSRGVPLASKAKSELYELRNLVVGKEVPDIEGEDLDAQKFKLSDYRGKVVLLDFWGHW